MSLTFMKKNLRRVKTDFYINSEWTNDDWLTIDPLLKYTRLGTEATWKCFIPPSSIKP